jgi:predicted negative regulator of RcsB-dependent stress response
MTRLSLIAPALALLLAAPLAASQQASPAQPAPATKVQPAPRHAGAPMDHAMHRRFMERGHGMGGAMADLRSLERLYREAGRDREMTAVYQDVLAKSQDPRLRTYAYHQLARLQARPANIDQAAATLRKSLAENLANEAKMRAERERMRTQRATTTAQ